MPLHGDVHSLLGLGLLPKVEEKNIMMAMGCCHFIFFNRNITISSIKASVKVFIFINRRTIDNQKPGYPTTCK